MIKDQELYDKINEFVEHLVMSLPASYDNVINALEEKIKEIKSKV